MATRKRVRPPEPKEVMVRVSPQHLGRAAICPIPRCGGSLRIESMEGYPVDVCVKCERRLELWSTLESQLKAVRARAEMQEARAIRAEAANLEMQKALHASRDIRRGPSVAAQVLAVLEASERALQTKDLREALPAVPSAHIGPALTYLALKKRIRRKSVRWGARFKYEYSAAKPAAVSHGD